MLTGNLPVSCDHVFAWYAVIPPSHCPKCGRCLGCGAAPQPPVVPYPMPYPYPAVPAYPYPYYQPTWGPSYTYTSSTTNPL